MVSTTVVDSRFCSQVEVRDRRAAPRTEVGVFAISIEPTRSRFAILVSRRECRGTNCKRSRIFPRLYLTAWRLSRLLRCRAEFGIVAVVVETARRSPPAFNPVVRNRVSKNSIVAHCIGDSDAFGFRGRRSVGVLCTFSRMCCSVPHLDAEFFEAVHSR